MRAGGDQLSPQRDDPAIARGRTGLDDQQRVVGFCPHQLRECCSFRVADLADHVACDYKVGRLNVSQRGAGFAVLVGHLAQARAVPAKIKRQRAQGAVGVQQRKACQRWKSLGRCPCRRSRPGADIEQACRREIGRDFAKRVQAGAHRGVGRRHPRQRIGKRIGLGPDRAGVAAIAIGLRDQ